MLPIENLACLNPAESLECKRKADMRFKINNHIILQVTW